MAEPAIRRIERGRISALLSNGELRRLQIDGIEVMRGAFFTARDADWSPLRMEAGDVDVWESAERTVIRCGLTHRSDRPLIVAQVLVELFASGEVHFEVKASPLAELEFNRIGICVLHPPATVAGRSFRARGAGAEVSGELPRLIAPQPIVAGAVKPLIEAFTELEIDVAGVGPCIHRLEGDLFELEDQRNWSDGSFKTYCTPLSRPRPQRLPLGGEINQALELQPPKVRPRKRPEPRLSVEVGERLPWRFPALGLGLGAALDMTSGPLVRALDLEHIRVDLRDRSHYGPALDQATADAGLAGCGLVLALNIGDRTDEELAFLAQGLAGFSPLPVVRVLVLCADGRTSPASIVTQARERLAGLLPDAELAGGTDRWFAELNRDRPRPGALGGLAWAVSPTVHADDELTLVEAVDALRDQLGTARSFAPDAKLYPGPVTLRPRYNPAAPDFAAQALDPPESSVDPRQGSAFAAAWTAASIGAMAEGGAAALTLYETVGPRGVLGGLGERTPCWEVLEVASRWRSSWTVAAASSRPLVARAVFAEAADGEAVEGMVVNLAGAARRLEVGPFGGERIQLRELGGGGESSARLRDGRVELALDPFGAVVLTAVPFARAETRR